MLLSPILVIILNWSSQNKNVVDTEFKYHGNYCGPGWSAGKYQNSVDSEVAPVDKLDAACQKHDRSYARGEDLLEADLQLIKDAWKLDPFLTLGIASQALLRKLGVMGRNGKRKKLTPKEKKQVRSIAKKVERKTGGGRGRFRARGGRRRKFGPPAQRNSLRRGANIKSRITKSQFGSSIVVGEDFATTVTTAHSPNPIPVGTKILQIDISPQSWTGTRLAQYANMYEKWMIESMSFWYEPTVATTEAGSLVGFIDPDPFDDLIATGTDALKKGMSALGGKMFQVSSPTAIHFKPERKGGDRFTNFDQIEDRLNSFGTFFLLAASNLDIDKTYGNIIIRYKLKFYKPILEISTSSVPESNINSVTYWEKHTTDDPIPFSPGTADFMGNTETIRSMSYELANDDIEHNYIQIQTPPVTVPTIFTIHSSFRFDGSIQSALSRLQGWQLAIPDAHVVVVNEMGAGTQASDLETTVHTVTTIQLLTPHASKILYYELDQGGGSPTLAFLWDWSISVERANLSTKKIKELQEKGDMEERNLVKTLMNRLNELTLKVEGQKLMQDVKKQVSSANLKSPKG